jgi:hypothetical protein
MKSAYELAMERLQKDDPNAAVTLTEEQKERLAEIDRSYQSKIAEREVFLQGKLSEALQSGDSTAADQIRHQISQEKARLEEEREEEKEKIRGEGKNSG